VENDRGLWKTLYHAQWPSIMSNGNGHLVSSYRAEFQRRYELRATVKQIVSALSLPLVTRQGLAAHLPNGRNWGLHQEEYLRLTNLLLSARTNTGTTNSTSQDDSENHPTKTAVPVFPATATLEFIESLHFFFDSTAICFTDDNDDQVKRVAVTERCVASHLVELFQVAHVYQEWQELLVLAANDPNDSDVNDRLLSAGINGVAQILSDEQQVAAFCASLSSVATAIESSLQAYTAQLQSVLQQEHLGSNNTPVLVVEALLTLMYDTWGFAGNVDNFYDLSNSSLYAAISLTVLAVLILRRLKVQAHAIGLPGIVVLGVVVTGSDDVKPPAKVHRVNSSINSLPNATKMSYFDIFHGKRQAVTVGYCRGLIPPDISWHDDFLKPMSSTAILMRMLQNLLSFLSQHMRPVFRDMRLLERIYMLDSLLQYPTREAATAAAAAFGSHNGHDEDVIPGLMPLSLNPQVFVNHGLMKATD
jgi:Transglutaminase-like superfamily